MAAITPLEIQQLARAVSGMDQGQSQREISKWALQRDTSAADIAKQVALAISPSDPAQANRIATFIAPIAEPTQTAVPAPVLPPVSGTGAQYDTAPTQAPVAKPAVASAVVAPAKSIAAQPIQQPAALSRPVLKSGITPEQLKGVTDFLTGQSPADQQKYLQDFATKLGVNAFDLGEDITNATIPNQPVAGGGSAVGAGPTPVAKPVTPAVTPPTTEPKAGIDGPPNLPGRPYTQAELNDFATGLRSFAPDKQLEAITQYSQSVGVDPFDLSFDVANILNPTDVSVAPKPAPQPEVPIVQRPPEGGTTGVVSGTGQKEKTSVSAGPRMPEAEPIIQQPVTPAVTPPVTEPKAPPVVSPEPVAPPAAYKPAVEGANVVDATRLPSELDINAIRTSRTAALEAGYQKSREALGRQFAISPSGTTVAGLQSGQEQRRFEELEGSRIKELGDLETELGQLELQNRNLTLQEAELFGGVTAKDPATGDYVFKPTLQGTTAIAGLTGQYAGEPTVAEKQRQFDNYITRADRFGSGEGFSFSNQDLMGAFGKMAGDPGYVATFDVNADGVFDMDDYQNLANSGKLTDNGDGTYTYQTSPKTLSEKAFELQKDQVAQTLKLDKDKFNEAVREFGITNTQQIAQWKTLATGYVYDPATGEPIGVKQADGTTKPMTSFDREKYNKEVEQFDRTFNEKVEEFAQQLGLEYARINAQEKTALAQTLIAGATGLGGVLVDLFKKKVSDTTADVVKDIAEKIAGVAGPAGTASSVGLGGAAFTAAYTAGWVAWGANMVNMARQMDWGKIGSSAKDGIVSIFTLGLMGGKPTTVIPYKTLPDGTEIYVMSDDGFGNLLLSDGSFVPSGGTGTSADFPGGVPGGSTDENLAKADLDKIMEDMFRHGIVNVPVGARKGDPAYYRELDVNNDGRIGDDDVAALQNAWQNRKG